MPQCKYCDRTISKDDYDICPHCGARNPIDPNYKTQNLTQVMLKKGDESLYKSKSKKVAVILECLLGPFGAAFFYMKHIVKGVVSLVTTLLALTAFILLSLFIWPFAFIIPIVVLWGFHIAFGIHILRSSVFKDGEGEYLR